MVPSLLIAGAGVLLAAVLCLVPALHVYSAAGLLLLAPAALGEVLPPECLAMLLVGMVTGYAVLNSLPSIFLAAPDESTVFIAAPGQRYLRQRRGYEAAVLTGMGGVGGVVVLALLMPIASPLLRMLRAVLRPHLHWILWAIIAYLLLSERPKGAGRAPAGWSRLWDGWRSLTAGLATFLLSGVLGIILFYRSLVPLAVAHQNLSPAFAGLFAVPWIIQNLLSRVSPPRQHVARTVDATPGLIVRGTLAGALGGLFAAFFPGVSGGIGGLLAGHATAQQDDRLFLVSQGASKVIAYGGALLLFFVPQLRLTRGGVAWLLSSIWTGPPLWTPYVATAVLVFSGVFSFLVLLPLARLASRLMGVVDYRWISLIALTALVCIVIGTTGWQGFLIGVVAAAVGLIPVLWGSRRSNCMGVLLLPLALNMIGAGSKVAGWLGLL